MKRLFAIFILLSALLTATIWVAAADPPTPGDESHGKPSEPPGQQKKSLDDKGKQLHSVSGAVTAKGTDTFTVTTKKGDTVIVKVLNTTRFQMPRQKNVTFADLEIGDRIAANGAPSSIGMDAKKVSIVPGKPSVQHRVGTVEEFIPGKSISIKTVQGEIEKFIVTADTKIQGKAAIGKGDRVTVVSHRDPNTHDFTAQAIVVQQP